MRSLTIIENEDGTATVFLKPSYEQVECANWEQAIECVAGGIDGHATGETKEAE